MNTSERWVLFDFGGVILTMNDKMEYQRLMTSVIETIGFPVQDINLFKKRVYGGPEFANAKVGAITALEMWQGIFERANLLPEQREALGMLLEPTNAPKQQSFPLEEIERMRDHVRLHGRHVHPGLLAFIEQLKGQGVRVAILSNYESDLLQVLEVLGVRGVFGDDAIISSHDIRAAKPKRESFFRALRRLRITPSPLLESQSGSVSPSTRALSLESLATPLDVSALSTSATDDGSPDTPSCALSPLPTGSKIAERSGESGDIDGDYVEGYFPNVIFVDDKESNVEGAKRCGIPKSIVYKTLAQCIHDVEAQLATMVV